LVTDFVYTPETPEIFRLLITNPRTNYITQEVWMTAWGGAVTFDQPMGNQFMGKRDFVYDHTFTTPLGCPCACVNQLQWQMQPSNSAWHDLTTFQFYTQSGITGICDPGGWDHIIFEIGLERTLLDGTMSDYCVVDPRIGVEDYFEIELFDNSGAPGSVPYHRKAFLYRGNILTTALWHTVGYIKC
jgi:hypothetical protein